MRLKLWFAIVFFIFTIHPKVVLAETPKLLTPANNETTEDASPKLSWEYSGTCSQDESCFRVEVDDSSDFSSLNKNTYTNNTYYSPQLSLGTWYWKVKAKNTSNQWSDYSDVWSFQIVSHPTDLQPTPSLDIQSNPTPTPSTQSSSSKSIFSVSSVPNSLKSSNDFSVQIILEGLDPNASYYLKGAFIKSGSTNYFGKTYVANTWVKNSESYSKQFNLTTDSSGEWLGDLKVMVDPEDSGFMGSGSYVFKVARYNSAGSGPTWSNEASLETIDDSPADTPKPTKSSSPKPSTSQKSSVSSPQSSSTLKSLNKSIVRNPLTSIRPVIASIAGVASEAASPASKNETDKISIASVRKFNWWFIGTGFITLIIGVSIFVYTFKKG